MPAALSRGTSPVHQLLTMWPSIARVHVLALLAVVSRVCAANETTTLRIVPANASIAEMQLRRVFDDLPRRLAQDKFVVHNCPTFESLKDVSIKLYGMSTAFSLDSVTCTAVDGSYLCEVMLGFRWVRFLIQGPGQYGEVALSAVSVPASFTLGRSPAENVPWKKLVRMHGVRMFQGTYSAQHQKQINNCAQTRLEMVNTRLNSMLNGV